MKNLSLNKKIYLSLIFVIIFCVIIGGTLLYKNKSNKKENAVYYKIEKLKKNEPLLFKGTVQAKKTSYLSLDQSLGKISNISVENGQEVTIDDVIVTYQNTTFENQADEQRQVLDKLTLAIENAQTNLDNAKQKQEQIEIRLSNNKNEISSLDTKKPEGEIKKAELDAKVDTDQQALDLQKDSVLQAKQTLDAANVDLNSANNAIELTQKKITTNITAPFGGIVYINEKGKTDNTIPYATIVSPETVINGLVTEYDYNKIIKDQKVSIYTLSDKKEIEGTIKMIDQLPETNTLNTTDTNAGKNAVANFSFTVEPKESIHYGYSVQISVPLNTLEIPKKSVIKLGKEMFVFLYKDGKVRKKTVQLQEKATTYVVENGLNEKDYLIINPKKELKDGQEVAVK
ncbi:efflux RND transporter periplasmic adaptor subunit [Carnobacterium maltaromaticum]|uniref:efflux RND transporter periplasmic adaptor subunit n=1 Tax=Carnobacterium maltaromaticum TaxID=2751 RepID=UPI000704CB47|nr:hypothetical protein [Carnobacterium maltaromaticum]